MNRRDFIRRGSLWVLGATIVTPELLERLTWTRRLWPGATFSRAFLHVAHWDTPASNIFDVAPLHTAVIERVTAYPMVEVGPGEFRRSAVPWGGYVTGCTIDGVYHPVDRKVYPNGGDMTVQLPESRPATAGRSDSFPNGG